MINFKAVALATLLSAGATLGHAGSWSLDADMSKVAFGSVKKDAIGEVHSFQRIDGAVSADGKVSLDIELASVETLIDIRNERMIEHVFKGTPMATVTTQIDMAAMEALGVGETTIFEADGALMLVGTKVEMYVELFVVRLSEDRVLVTTNDMIMLSTEDAGVDGGIDILKGLADLSGITRVSPVTLRLMFDKDA